MNKEHDVIWKELQIALDYFWYPGLPENQENDDKEGFEKLKKCFDVYGPQTVLEVLKKRLGPGTFSDHLSILAQAGIGEVEAELRVHIPTANSGNIARFAVGLAYLGHEDGFELIESLCKGLHPVKIPDTPKWHFADHLKKMDHPRAKKILHKIQMGAYD